MERYEKEGELVLRRPPLYHAKDLSRSDQRALILHLLYTYELHERASSLEALIFTYERGFGCVIEPEGALFQELTGIVEHADALEEEIKPFLANWRLERLSLMTRLILRYAMWELKIQGRDLALVINEAVELAKGFGEADSYRFINGVLDAWIKRERIPETSV